MTQEIAPAAAPIPITTGREQARVVLDDTRIQLLKTQLMPPDTTDGELMLFAEVCRKWNLDPFLRQVYALKQGTGRLQIAATIDGLRLIAARTGEYRGQTAPQWCGPDGRWRDVWLSEEPPAAAKVGVWREGFLEPAWGIATFAAYAQNGARGLIGQWAQNPSNQLAKCAEALALRKAFPADMSGLYSEDELDNADDTTARRGARRQPTNSRPTRSASAAPNRWALTREETDRFWREAREQGVTAAQVRDMLGGKVLSAATRSEAMRAWAEFGNPPADAETGEIIDAEALPAPDEAGDE